MKEKEISIEIDEEKLIEEHFRKNFPKSTCSDFIIGKYNDKISIDDVFDNIKNSFSEYYMRKDALQLNGYKYGVFFDEQTGRFDFVDGNISSKKNQKINKEIEEKFGINTFDSFYGYYDFSKFETYKEYEKHWVSKIMNAEDFEAVFAPLVIVDSSKQKEYSDIQTGLSKIFGKKSLRRKVFKLKKEILTRNIMCYKSLSDVDCYSEVVDFFRSCDKCEQNKALCRLCEEYYNKMKEEDIDKIISNYGKIIVSISFKELPYRVLYDLAKISIFCN